MININRLPALLIFLLLTSCQFGGNMRTTHNIRTEILSLIPKEANINIKNDHCKEFDDRPNTSYSCFISREDSTKVFNSTLKSLIENNYHYKSAVRQDYGIWSVILRKDGNSIVIRCAELDSAKEGESLDLKNKGYRSEIDITVRKEEKTGQ